jgi:PTS system mannose-specific IID component
VRLDPAGSSLSVVSRGVRVAMFLRSFAIQGSFNYRTLIGTGCAFVLLPALRRIFAGRSAELSDAIKRHQQIFNSHPYLAGIALGAIARLEAEGTAPAVIDRFKAAVRSSLGSLGDNLFWAGWRPFCALAALLLACSGASWWLPVACFLVLYNIGHLLARAWSFRMGLRYGRAVAEHLRGGQLQNLQRFVASAGAFMLGLVLPLAAGGGLVESPSTAPWLIAAATAALLGLRFGSAVRTPVVVALTGFALFGIAWGIAA